MKRRALLLAAAAVVGSLAGLSVSGRADRAAAGTTGASPGVFFTGGDLVEFSSLAALQSGGASAQTLDVVNGGQSGVLAVNATATRMVTNEQFDGGPVVAEYDARTGAPITSTNGMTYTGSGRLEGVNALAMDPSNSNRAFAVSVVNVNGSFVYEVDVLNLSGLTIGPFFSLPATNSLTWSTMAIAPGGGTLFVAGAAGRTEQVLSIPVGNPGAFTTWQTITPSPTVDDLAVSPDGSFLYAVGNAGGRVSTHGLIGWKLPLPTGGATFFDQIGSIGAALTVSPDGHTVYTASHTGGSVGSNLQAFNATTGAAAGSLTVPIFSDPNTGGGVEGIAISPDAQTLLALGTNTPPSGAQAVQTIYSVQLPGLTLGKPSNFPNMTFGVGPQDIAITPDQAPHAHIAPTSASGCTQFNIDASGSSIVYGSIVSYAWNFGDGHIATTSTPTVPHTYAAGGSYTVTVTETDSAGTSLPPALSGTSFAVDGPGQTPYKRASNQAQTSIAIPVSPCGTPPPPTTATTVHHNTTTTTKPTKKLHPKLTVTPVLGPPGTIVTIKGTGFQPGIPVTVTWSVSTGSTVVTPDSHDNFTTSLPILIPDVLGPRVAQASSSPPAKAKFLVVVGSAEPGGSQGSYLFRSEGP